MKTAQELKAKKVILFTNKKYDSKFEEILEQLLKRKIELFCAVGKDCAKWEDAIDWLYVENKKDNGYHITTTCHPDETLEDVKEFAKLWSVEGSNKEVQFIEI